jgi:hypothetical protein
VTYEQQMAEPEVEAAWRAEFRRVHETEAFHSGNVFLDRPKAPFRWSGDQAEARRLQEEHTHHYLRWTLLGYRRCYDRRPYRRGPIVFGLKRAGSAAFREVLWLAHHPVLPKAGASSLTSAGLTILATGLAGQLHDIQ